MYLADLIHPSETLAAKLRTLYDLRSDKKVDLGFNKPFLKLLESFGNPHLALPPVIHVAGTNGKGSIIATLRALLEAHGKTVSAFTSPHMLQFNERLYMNGNVISNHDLEAFIDEALDLNAGGKVTFFEITTAMALAAFARVKSDYCLLEVGLGGRLDCTNVVPAPAVCVIGKISYDHTEYLGDTLCKIAAEKAGIIKRNVPCVIAPQSPDFIKEGGMEIFKEIARKKNAPLYIFPENWAVNPQNDMIRFIFKNREITLPKPSLLGAHQVENAGAALAALHLLPEVWNQELLAQGMRNIHWPGRLENISALFDLPGCEVWYDGGCNDSAAAVLAAQIRQWAETDSCEFHLVVGMKGDKSAADFITPLRPLAKSLTIVPVHGVSKCLQPEAVKGALSAKSVREACAAIAAQNPQTPKRILVTGSLYLMQDIRHTS